MPRVHPVGETIDEAACRTSVLLEISALLTKRWTGGVMLALSRGADRFSQIQAMVQGISGRLLSARLRELEQHGLVERVVTPTMPVSVSYALTDRGRMVLVSLSGLADVQR